MADGLYVSMAGAAARATQLDSVSDNLANANSPGYKAGRPAFQTFLTSANDKAYPEAVATGFDLRPGELQRTGNPLDVVPEGTSFLSVQVGDRMGFTRDGRLKVDADGYLLAGTHRLLDVNGAVISVPPGAPVVMQSDGIVTAFGNPLAQVALFQLEGPLERMGPGILVPTESGAAIPVVSPLRIGELEKGNSNALEAAVAMVSVQRHYENSIQALQTYKRMDERAVEIGRVR